LGYAVNVLQESQVLVNYNIKLVNSIHILLYRVT